jgi:hypothetical protein
LKPLKADVTEMAELLEAGAETASALAEAVIELRTRQMSRRYYYSAEIRALNVTQVVGPYTTVGQAEKAVREAAHALSGRGRVVFQYTPEGWAQHMRDVDEPRLPGKGWDDVALDAQAFKNGWKGAGSRREDHLPKT